MGYDMSREEFFESTQITSTTDTLGRSISSISFDMVARISGNFARISGSSVSQSLKVELASADSLMININAKFMSLRSDISRLQHFAHWQHKLLDYNASYIALLLEQIDDEEFERVAAEHAETAVHPEVQDLSLEISRIQSLTGLPLSVMDYSNMFGVGEDEVVDALGSIDTLNDHSLNVRSLT